jgi:hypothetical protein
LLDDLRAAVRTVQPILDGVFAVGILNEMFK